MKAILIGLVVTVGMVMALHFIPSEVEVIQTDPVVETVTVDSLEERIKKAQDEAKVDIETRAQEAYNALYQAEMKKVEDSIKTAYIAEIEATITSPDY